MSQIIENMIVQGFDGKNYWPHKILKVTAKSAKIVSVNLKGEPIGEPIMRKISHACGKPTVKAHACEIVYLTEPYKNELFMAGSDI